MEKKEIGVLTGSIGSISEDLSKKYNITVIPYYLNLKDKSLKDGVDISSEEYYSYFENLPELPTTASPNISDIKRTIEEIAKNYKQIIFLCASDKYTKTYGYAVKAIQSLKNIKVYLIDTKAAIGKQGLMAIETAKLIKSGETIENIAKKIKEWKFKMREVICLDTLKNLYKGGRIGKLQYLLGNVLSIKTLIRFDNEGMHELIGIVRTHQQTLNFTIKRIRKILAGYKTNKLDIFIEDAINRNWSNKLKEIIQKEFNCREIYQTTMSPVTGTHAGPKSWAITILPL
ncbi:MAG: DegV family protein [Candidatus Cloacimonadota bacterium]|nr:DegV family protein [Candidatus Cloacimonadota bacterium]